LCVPVPGLRFLILSIPGGRHTEYTFFIGWLGGVFGACCSMSCAKLMSFEGLALGVMGALAGEDVSDRVSPLFFSDFS
jgi:hypothetical protein